MVSDAFSDEVSCIMLVVSCSIMLEVVSWDIIVSSDFSAEVVV